MADLIPATATLITVKGRISKVRIILPCAYFVLINAAYFTYILIKHSHVVTLGCSHLGRGMINYCEEKTHFYIKFFFFCVFFFSFSFLLS